MEEGGDWGQERMIQGGFRAEGAFGWQDARGWMR